MANIKISELDELQKATDQDLLVIVDVANNETKKIQAGNLGTGGAEIPIGPTPPENPEEGDFWIDTSANGETYGDTLPIGAIVEYNGTTVPQGYEKVNDGNIVESGSTDTGNWVKFSDGTMIWVGSITINQIPCDNKIGALYRCAGNTYGNVNYGIEFKETPKLFCTQFGNYPIILNSAGKGISKTSTGYILISHYQNETVFDETFNYFVIGKWK